VVAESVAARQLERVARRVAGKFTPVAGGRSKASDDRLGKLRVFEHGTRARYVQGCRCDDCRAANLAAYYDRAGRARAAAAELGPRTETHCVGVHGEPCPRRTKLRMSSTGNLCAECRRRLVWNGFVPAGRARAHLAALSRAGVGRRAVAQATDISESILHKIRHGLRNKIRARTERLILDVDVSVAADNARVDARPVWRMIARLIRVHGFTKAKISERIGQGGRALQLGKRRVTVRNAHRIAKLLADAEGAFLDGHDGGAP
jgi:hypothetical protein